MLSCSYFFFVILCLSAANAVLLCSSRGEACRSSSECCSQQCLAGNCTDGKSYNDQGTNTRPSRIAIQFPVDDERDNEPDEYSRPGSRNPVIETRSSWGKQANLHLLPNLDECGEAYTQRTRRVIGGVPATIGQFPWMTKLMLLNISSGNSTFRCGGSVINSRYILTAAHCVSRLPAGTHINSVILGSFGYRHIKHPFRCSLYNETSPLKFGFSCSALVEDIIIHEDFTRTTLENDVALIRLKEPLNLDGLKASVRPICLPADKTLFKQEETNVVVAGWGRIDSFYDDEYVKPDRLTVVNLRIVAREYCDFFHSIETGRLKEDRMCLLGRYGKSLCNGDSGSQVTQVVVAPNGKKLTFAVGVAVYGDELCGLHGSPLVATNVAEYIPWILNNIEE